jgi:two-component sensor histidine kinase
MPDRTPCVLYIDDDPALVRLVAKALERRGYLFEHAATSEAGLERISRGGIDVVVLDHYLPTGTGLDVLAKLGALTDRPEVVYVTGSAEMAIAVAALKAGASDYVPKTVADEFMELLLAAIEQAISHVRLARAKALAEQEVREARDRAEMLLGEVNHRVANSLAMVASLVGLQANALVDPVAKEALGETQVRIQAIAGVHRHLYTAADARSVQIGDYLRSLALDLEASIQAVRTAGCIAVEADNFAIPTEQAASLGVIVTELVTNALKYAYAGREAGDVRIVLTRSDGVLELRVEDDGVGWDGLGTPQGTGLGSRIVRAMAKGLSATLEYDTSRAGTVARLRFPA